MATTTALDVRISAQRPAVQQFVSTLTNVRLALQEIDLLSRAGARLERPKWVVDDIEHRDRIYNIRLTAADSATRDRESMLRPVSALVDGVHVLRDSPVLPDYYSESTVERLVKMASPRGGIEEVSLASVNGQPGPYERLDREVVEHAQKAVQGDEISIGSVTGFVHEIKKLKDSCRATVFDPVRNRAVTCRARVEMEAQLRNAWPHRVVARGKITRNAEGQAIRIDLANLELLAEDDSRRPPAIALRGALPGMTGGLSTEEFMRELRDG